MSFPAEYPFAVVAPAHIGNYQAGRSGSAVGMIVVHTTEGGDVQGALERFQGSDPAVSAQYIVDSDGTIYQCVQETNAAYHAGNLVYNRLSIGIEHVGYLHNADHFPDVQMQASAKLTAHLCAKYHIPIDRQHIIGHNEVPNPHIDAQHPWRFGGQDNHPDPGALWPWASYLNQIRAAQEGQGYQVPPDFFSYYQQHGGLPIFGLPITTTLIYNGLFSQWFERARFERHADGGVHLALIGVDAAKLRGYHFPPATQGQGALYFPQTQHNLAHGFRDYWQNNGGLPIFGYPISEEFVETEYGNPYTVQYFERARFEWHTETGMGKVELGLIGVETKNAAGIH